MKQTSFFSTVLLAAFVVFVFPCFVAAQDFVGTYRIDIPGSASMNTTRERVDSQTVQRTDTTTIGKGARGAGVLEIKADGTYALRDFIGYGKLKTGKWIANDEGKFSDKGGIELLEVKSADYGEDDRSWFVFINDDGEVEAREAPYTYYNRLRLTKTAGKSITTKKTKSLAGDKSTSENEKDSKAQQKGSLLEKKSVKTPSGKARRWTVAEFRQYFEGKTPEEVEAVLGKPAEIDYKKWIYVGLQIVDENDNNAVRTKAYISFTEVKGGTVWHMTFF